MGGPDLRITPPCDWQKNAKAQCASAFHSITANNLRLIRGSAEERRRPLTYIDIELATEPALNLPELKRIAQVACHFGTQLIDLLDPRQPRTLDQRYSTHRHQAMDHIDNQVHTFNYLVIFFHRILIHSDSFRIYFYRPAVRAPHCLCKIFNPTPDRVVSSLETVVAFFEASLAWPGGGYKALSERWACTKSGLKDFLDFRGTEARLVVDRPGGASRTIITPFTVAKPTSRAPAPPVRVQLRDLKYSLDPTDWEYEGEAEDDWIKNMRYERVST